jgi:predicted nucleic acid-binding protein
MIMDACVLIDFLKTDRSVLSLFVKHIGPVHVISPVVEEVKNIDNVTELIELGLFIVEPELDDAFEAISRKGPTSFQDNLCLLTAKRNGFTCVTNDKNLREYCLQEGVSILWGLQLLAMLCKQGGISRTGALDIAEQIHKSNPKHITASILGQFTDKVNSSDE